MARMHTVCCTAPALLLLAGCTTPSAQADVDARPLPDSMATPTLASRIAAMPRNLPRAEGPPLEPAMTAARAAVRACADRGVPVSVLVADSVGEPVVLLSGDGAGVRSQLIAQTKVNIVIRYGRSSIAVAQDAEGNPALAAEAATDPGIGMLRGGGLPIMREGRIIGAVAVSGAGLSGNMTMDEDCAQVAIDYLLAH